MASELNDRVTAVGHVVTVGRVRGDGTVWSPRPVSFGGGRSCDRTGGLRTGAALTRAGERAAAARTTGALLPVGRGMDRPPPAPPRADCPSGLLHAALWAERPGCRVPIYTRLVAEWRARGRTVPARPDVPCVASSSVRRLRRDEDGTYRP